MMPDLDVAQLKRFVAVVECGGFAAAARQLNMTQQALSASIARLEESTGVRFIDRRRGSGIALTAFGRLLLERARTHLALSDRLMHEIALLRDARGGSIAIGVGETMTGRPVARAIARFNAAHPEVQLRLIEGYTEALVPRLATNELDFVLGGPSYALEDSGAYEFHHLFDVADALAVRAHHPLAGRDQVTLAELVDFPWLVPGGRNDVFRHIELAFARAKLAPPRNMLRSDATVLGSWLLLDNDYVICVSPDMVGAYIDNGLIRLLDCPGFGLVRHACLFTRRPAQLVPAGELLMTEIIHEVRQSHTT